MKLMKYLEKKYGYGADLNMAGVGNIFKISENKRSFAVKTLIASIIVMVLLLFSLLTVSYTHLSLFM